MHKRVTINGRVWQDAYEDSRTVFTAQVDEDGGGEDESPLVVRLLSWSAKKDHQLLESMIGKRVRITIDVEPEPAQK